MNKAIVEVGSTVTKVDVYDGENIKRVKDETILFKKNYSVNNEISDEDFKSLVDLVNALKSDYDDIYVCGTSIFRILEDNEKLRE